MTEKKTPPTPDTHDIEVLPHDRQSDEQREAQGGRDEDDDDIDEPGAENRDDADDDGQPSLVDESQFDDGDDDDDDMPDHFGAVAHTDPPRPIDDSLLVPAADSEIPLDLIDKDALWVVKRLQAKGFEAYLTGGCVRDLLLGRTPKDFDVATAAHPNQVRNVFRNCRIVGRRFRLAHVFFPSGKVIETATFRKNPTEEQEDLPSDLLVERDNVFGTVEEDARRRDLTVNGLFYDPLKGRVLDFVDGRKDLDARLIRTIGTPNVRFQEDPVRILRAIKFAVRLGFEIEEATYAAMRDQVQGLLRCAPARLQEELLRLLTSGHAQKSIALCDELGVLDAVMPELASARDMALIAAPITVQALPVAADTAHVNEQAADTTELSGLADSAAPVVDADAPGSVAEAVVLAPIVVDVVAPIPTSEERHARLKAMLGTLDAVKTRDADLTSAVVLAALLVPAYEAMRHSTTDFVGWFEELAQKWTDRIRLTRIDRERIPMLLLAQDELHPARRHGQHARAVVSRPSFREALLLLTMRDHAAGKALDEVGLWKAIAHAHQANYRQARVSERGPRQRTASVAQGGGGGRGRGGRDGGGGRDRGARRRRR